MAINSLGLGSSSGISIAGISSGLNTTAIIDALLAVETRAIKQPLLDRKSGLQTKLSALSAFETKLNALKDKAGALDALRELLAYSATPSNEDALTATADGTAIEGTHTIVITSTAKAESEASQPYADANATTVGTGTLQINYAGTVYDVAINSSNNTLNGVANAINSTETLKDKVNATVVNTAAQGATPEYKLIITAKETGKVNGEDDVITFNSVPNGGVQQLSFANQLVAATNAVLTVDGVAGIERTSNTISGSGDDVIIPGVTLNLLGTASSFTLTVGKDTEEVKERIQEFVSAYNDLASFMKAQQKKTEGQNVNPLFNDISLSVASSRLPALLVSVQNTDLDSDSLAHNLAQIGITVQADKTLKLNTEKLDAALDSDFEDVGRLFAEGENGDSDGVAKQIFDFARNFINGTSTDGVNSKGLIASVKDQTDSRIATINEQLLKADTRLSKLQDRLTKQFSMLEQTLGKLQSQGSFLGQSQFQI